MLLAIRERVMGIVGWVLLALLFVAFAFFGLNSYLSNSATGFAASVNDVEITEAEQMRAYRRLRSNLQARLGAAYDPGMIDEEMLKKNALQSLIREQLLLDAVKSGGFTISHELLAAQISSVDAFRNGDSFSSEKYQRILRQQGLSPGEFEQQLLRELVIQQYLDGITKTAGTTPQAVADIYRLQAQQRRFRYIKLPVSGYFDGLDISDAEIEQYYADNNPEFMSPERVMVQYVELTADDIEVDSGFKEEDLRALYEELSDRYTVAEQRQARHILVSVPSDAGNDAVDEARARARLITERLDKGESFAELAKSESDDPGSAANGGDLGFFGKDVMAREFENAVFSLEVGERSDVVRTPFGFHIIELTAVKPAVVTPFEDVRDELVEEYLSSVRKDMFIEYSDSLANLAFENPDSLDSVADELGLELKTSDWLTRDGGPGIGEYPEVVATAFQQDVLESGNNSEPVEVGVNHQIVLRILEHEPAALRPLESVREVVAGKVRDLKARARAREAGETMQQQLIAGTPIEDIANNSGLELMDSGLIYRTAEKPEKKLVQQAFRMRKPVDDVRSVAGVALENGDYVVLLLDDVRDGVLSGIPDDERRQLTRNISNILGRSEGDALVNALRDNAAIIIPENSQSDL